MFNFLHLKLLITILFTVITVNNGHKKMMINSKKIASTLVSLSLPLMSMSTFNVNSVHAVVQDDFSISRLKAVGNSLKDLDANWDKKVGSDGDAVRRVLGTVFTPPRCDVPLCGFEKFGRDFLKNHLDDITDIDAFDTELGKANDFLNQADFLAYSAIFSEYGNGGGGKDYIAESRVQVKKAVTAIDALQTLIQQ